jgi:hypothetical protein
MPRMTNEELFDLFWQAYPKRKGKGIARKSFYRAMTKKTQGEKTALVEKMICAVESECASPEWAKDDGQYIPHPTTWLNQERWEDEAYQPKRQRYAPQRRTVTPATIRQMDMNRLADFVVRESLTISDSASMTFEEFQAAVIREYNQTYSPQQP